jgi:nucleotide-binding universal stress UspA family protein
MGRIVVGVDGSPHSVEALRWAIDEARRRDATIEAISAWQYPWVATASPMGSMPIPVEQVETDTIAMLDATIAAACPDAAAAAAIERHVVVDGAAHALLTAAEGAELLVVGARGHGGFVGLVLGSVATQVAQHATCPVVIVPRGALT